MNENKRAMILENVYAAVLAEATYYYTKEDILEKVTNEKEKMQMMTAQRQNEQFGITKPEGVFETLTEVFNCAKWEIDKEQDGFTAKTTGCKLCALAKKMGAGSPCKPYCLNPMKTMVKALEPKYNFDVESTLYEGDCCSVKVSK